MTMAWPGMAWPGFFIVAYIFHIIAGYIRLRMHIGSYLCMRDWPRTRLLW
jgi:hypothetical protein